MVLRVIRSGVLGTRKMETREAIAFHLFAAPWILGFLVFTAYPTLASLFLSFTHYEVIRPAEWIGVAMIIYLAGLQGIPQHLYEAAELDGADVLVKFRMVTIPMVTPVIFFNLILSIIGSFQTFTAAYVMTQGGPANGSLFYALYLY